jgi:hypothetical protein
MIASVRHSLLAYVASWMALWEGHSFRPETNSGQEGRTTEDAYMKKRILAMIWLLRKFSYE